ncbi:MAG: hypothetical protein ACREJU_11865, partial [Nitrospiraceae bacterium]
MCWLRRQQRPTTTGRQLSPPTHLLIGCALMVLWAGNLWLREPAVTGATTPAQAEAVPDPSGESTAPPPAEKCASPVGPALEVPRELLELLNQRKLALDRREEAVRTAEARLKTLRDEMEGMLSRYEQAVKTTETKRRDAKQKQLAAEQAAYQASLG